MAAVAVTVTTVDEKNKSFVSKLHVPTGFDPSEYADFAVAFAQLVANLQDGQITDVGVSIPIDASSLFAAASTLADAAEKAFFSVATVVSGLYTKYIIPMFDRTNIIAGTDQIDTADVNVAAVISMYEEGIDVGLETFHFEDSRGNETASLSSARATFLERS